jgi:hypothetical protein
MPLHGLETCCCITCNSTAQLQQLLCHAQRPKLIATPFATLTFEATRMNVTSGLVITAWNSKPLLTTTLTARHEQGSNSTSSAVSRSGPMFGSFCQQNDILWIVTKGTATPFLA